MRITKSIILPRNVVDLPNYYLSTMNYLVLGNEMPRIVINNSNMQRWGFFVEPITNSTF